MLHAQQPSLDERLAERRKRVNEKFATLCGTVADARQNGANPPLVAPSKSQWPALPAELGKPAADPDTTDSPPEAVEAAPSSRELKPDSKESAANVGGAPGEVLEGEGAGKIAAGEEKSNEKHDVAPSDPGESSRPQDKAGESGRGSKSESEPKAAPVAPLEGSPVAASVGENGTPPEPRTSVRVSMSRHAAAVARAEAEKGITDFFIKDGAVESARRKEEEALASERAAKIAQEKQSCAELVGAIQLRFQSLYDLKIPHDLKVALDSQKEKCDSVILAKDEIIRELEKQINTKDEELVRMLARQSDELDAMMQEMRAHSTNLGVMHAKQLEAVEETYTRERRELLEKCSKEVFQLVKLRRSRENGYRKSREQKLAEAQAQLDERHDSNYEAFNEIKFSGQQEIHALVQELERCKADFLLNAERLEYNLQVLRERVKENKLAQSQYKRKLGKLQDLLSSLVAKYSESEKRFQKANKDLTEQLRRVTRQYKETQEKFKFFEKGDVEKYQRIWKMHETRCMGLVNQCLLGDRVVFEDIFGVPWAPPPLEQWASDAGVGPRGSQESGMERNWVADGVDASDDGGIGSGVQLSVEAAVVLQVLYQQVPFVLVEKVRSVIQILKEDQATLVTLDAVLNALGIDKSDEVQKLVAFFTVDTDDGSVALIHPQEATRALTAYLAERQRTSSNGPAAKTELGSSSHVGGAGNAASLGGTTMTASIVRSEQERQQREAKYWTQLMNVIPASHLRLWDAVEKGLQQYLSQLQLRERLIDETDSIRSENLKLRSLLTEYLGSSINEELHFPPQLRVESNGVSIQSTRR